MSTEKQFLLNPKQQQALLAFARWAISYMLRAPSKKTRRTQ